MTLPVLPKDGISLILYGDVPLVRQTTLEQLIEASNKTSIGMITLHVDNPTGYTVLSAKTVKSERLLNIKTQPKLSVKFKKSTQVFTVSAMQNCMSGCLSFQMKMHKANTI